MVSHPLSMREALGSIPSVSIGDISPYLSPLIIIFDPRMFLAVLGECASTMWETQRLQKQSKQVHIGPFL